MPIPPIANNNVEPSSFPDAAATKTLDLIARWGGSSASVAHSAASGSSSHGQLWKDTHEQSEGGNLSHGEKIGVGFAAGVGALAIIAIAVALFLRYRKKKKGAASETALAPYK